MRGFYFLASLDLVGGKHKTPYYCRCVGVHWHAHVSHVIRCSVAFLCRVARQHVVEVSVIIFDFSWEERERERKRGASGGENKSVFQNAWVSLAEGKHSVP